MNTRTLLAGVAFGALAAGLATFVAPRDAEAGMLTLLSDTVNETWTIGATALPGGFVANSTNNASVAITNRPGPWVANGTALGNAGALWVSYAQTGSTGSLSPPNTWASPWPLPGAANITASLIETFTLANAGFLTNLEVYADDTAAVFLDGVAVPSLGTPQAAQNGACAAGIIACQVGEGGLFMGSIALAPGVHTLRIDVYQKSGNGFGAQFAANVNVVPIPAALPMLGAAVAGLGLAGWRRRRAAV